MRMAICAIVVWAASPIPASAQATPWAQKIFFGVTSHDFGVCPRGAKLKHRFRMKNIYAVPLKITNIRSSCGCLSFEASTYELQPKEEGYLDIVMDAGRFVGPKSISLFITVGPKFISTAVIRVTANARTDVVFNPGEVRFGVVEAGQTPTQTISVEYAGELDWRILEVVKSKSAPFSVLPTELFRQSKSLFKSGKVGYQIAVTLRPDAPPGAFKQELLLKTNDPASPVLTVCVEGNIQAPLTVRPEVVKLGAVKMGQKATHRVVVRGNRPFRILSVEGSGNGVDIELPNTSATFHVIDILCQPQQAGEFARNITFRTDMGENAAVSVRVQAQVQQ